MFLALQTADAFSAPAHKSVASHRGKAAKAEKSHHKQRPATEARRLERAVGPRILLPSDQPIPTAPLSHDLALTKQALQLVRQRKFADATTLARSIGDTVAQKLVEWALLRNPDDTIGFNRYALFISANADWPSVPLRRRAEARLLQEQRDGATVRRFVGEEPVSAPGRLALARVLLRGGDHEGAAREARAVWRSAEMSGEMEAAVAGIFDSVL